MAHSNLPQPAIFNHVKHHYDELTTTLQPFLDRHAPNASKLTIDDDNVGRGLICAFANGSSKIEGVMLYLKKPEIQRYLEKQGYKCTPCPASTVIQCVMTNKSSSSLAKL
ncbi:ATP-dependent RNA helicase dbp10 [Mucor velutinosus]|uniref:ATP-dependent RNA helicase dbp10 n=1 Tax=Mucor velutinosus TaxID=708070 RepID=A0AAN7D784_9FUNG|nr:ATP-dependent RNA helicase dbp10 [Mucor velutinosus]